MSALRSRVDWENESQLTGAYSEDDAEEGEYAYNLDDSEPSVAGEEAAEEAAYDEEEEEEEEEEEVYDEEHVDASTDAHSTAPKTEEDGADPHQRAQRVGEYHKPTTSYEDFLSPEEIARADAVFDHVVYTHNKPLAAAANASATGAASSGDFSSESVALVAEEINFDQFEVALSLLGQRESNDKLKDMFLLELQSSGGSSSKRGKETINRNTFKRLIAELRLSVLGAVDQMKLIVRIRDAFDALYEGTCEFDDQRDEYGEKYIYAKALRQHLTTLGNVLSDEEADELIKECHPVEVPNAEGVVRRRIYFKQFRSMLLDKGM